MKKLTALLFVCLLLLANVSSAVILLDGNIPPGCTVASGVLTCTGFVGDGSGLTDVPSDGNDTEINRLIDTAVGGGTLDFSGTTGTFSGAVTASQFDVTRTTDPQQVQLYEGTGDGNESSTIRAVARSKPIVYLLPANDPTTDNNTLLAGEPNGDNETQLRWGPVSITEPILNIALRGGGSAISTGSAGNKRIASAATITGYTITSSASCSITVDLWKTTYTSYDVSTHPVDGDSITASAPITLTTAVKAKDETLTGWTKTLSADDIIHVNVDSADCTGDVDIQVYGTRSL